MTVHDRTTDPTFPWPEVDGSLPRHLEARTPVEFGHRMQEHALLSLDAVAELAGRLGPGSLSSEKAVKPLLASADNRDDLEVSGDIPRQIRELATNGAWFTLLNIEQDPQYHALVDEVVEHIAERAGVDERLLTHRMGFVFASSPNSTTSAHFDIEHSFIMQLQGQRTLGFGRFADADAREEEIRRYWGGSFGRLATLPTPLVDFSLGAGDGAYIPPYHPHWLTNTDHLSLSLTVTFFTDSNLVESRAQALNAKLRRLHLDPRPADPSRRTDRAKAQAMAALSATRQRLRGGVSTSGSR